MLMPIIAAVGSFVVSERILKPKATALVILICLAIYDIFISPPIPIVDHHNDNANGSEATIAHNNSTTAKIHNNPNSELDEFWQYDSTTSSDLDVIYEDELSTSLRCYRGPALLAFSLFCASYSLRIWRRNGVAVDELIFLPGTPHEFRLAGGSSGGIGIGSSGSEEDGEKQNKSSHGVDNVVEVEEGEATNDHNSTTTTTNRGNSNGGEITEETISPIKSWASEGDADAAAGAARPAPSSACNRAAASTRTTSLSPQRPQRKHSRSHEDIIASSSSEQQLETISSSSVGDVELLPLMIESGGGLSNISAAPTSVPLSRLRLLSEDSPITFIRDQALRGIDMLVIRKNLRPPPLDIEVDLTTGESSSPGAPTTTSSGNNKSSDTYDAEYAPSAPMVLGAALDLSLPVLFNFHMFVVLMKSHYKKEAESFIESGGSLDDAGDRIMSKVDVRDDLSWMKPPDVPPQVLPLFFITPLLIRSLVPPRQRRRFYNTVLQGTIFSPFKPVRFRDAFLADCVTSMVRVIKDAVNAIAYYWTVIFGLISGRYDLDKAGQIISHSMLMHGLVLPALSILPLFIKFLQTLRQAYDTGKRWPYLGNAFKYFTAGLVVLYGMTHAAGERNVWWIWSFVLSCIYQIVWDSCMDWELLVFMPREPSRMRSGSWIANFCRSARDTCNQIRLRPKRLFDDDSFYWKALFLNAMLRFCWMAGFIPAYRVSILDGSTQVTFVDKAHGWSFVFVGVLEIFRRTIWGIIKVELETIKLTSDEDHDLAMASTADEYLREGKWVVPRAALARKKKKPSTCQKVLSRCRSGNKRGRSNSMEGGTPSQFSKVEQSEQIESDFLSETIPKEKQRHRWLCFSVSGRFLRWLFILELLLWPCIFLVSSYYIVMSE